MAPLLPTTTAPGSVDVLWLAGEHSGDQHAARVATQLKQLKPDWRQLAIGGPALEAAGFEVLHDLTENSVVGLVEVLRHYGYFKQLFEELVEWIRTHRPRVLVLVDYPGFNLRLAKRLHAEGLSRQGGGDVSIYYYISPQIWAWKAKRRFTMAEHLDEMGVIFPFEVESYADTRLPVHFVGHPFLEPSYDPPVVYAADGSLLLLPGSRVQPVRRIFPALLDAVETWQARNPEAAAHCPLTVLAANAAIEAELRAMLATRSLQVTVHRAREPIAARMVLTSSGTMSLSCALAGVPGAIVYRAHPLTYFFGRRLVKIPYLGIANLILDRPMYREYLQADARPARLADELEAGLSPDRRAVAAADAAELRHALAAPSTATAAMRVAALAEA